MTKWRAFVVIAKATMTAVGTSPFDTSGDAARAAELRRVKLLATLVLATTFAVFIGAKWMREKRFTRSEAVGPLRHVGRGTTST